MTGRVFAIIECVAGHPTGVSLAALTGLLGIPKPTVMRIANDLARRGLLERDRNGYRMGRRTAELGTRAAHRQELRGDALPHLHELYATVGHCVFLTALVAPSQSWSMC